MSAVWPPDKAESGLGPIPTLPIFFKLAGRRVVLAGGALPAVWKAELLAAAGAQVQVFDPLPCPDMRLLQGKLGNALTLVERDWRPDDLADAAIAIGALEGASAESLQAAARAAGVPVNIVDIPHLCDFQFGTLVARSPLLIAISTDGAAPVFGQALRTRIEALLPAEIAAWAQAAKDWRPDLQARHLNFAARRAFWEAFADRALGNQGALPTDNDRQACLDAALGTAAARSGTLDLVGLGPGDPDLVTLRAVRALQSADVIFHGADVDGALTGLGRREAQLMAESGDPILDAETLRAFVEDGKRVAWAALGDPFTCQTWLDRRALATVEPKTIIPGIRCATCPHGCAAAASFQ